MTGPIGYTRPTRSGRSHFDAYRWRCANTGAHSCGVWFSAVSKEKAHEALTAHAVKDHG